VFVGDGWPAIDGASGTLQFEVADGAVVAEALADVGDYTAVVINEDARAGVFFAFAALRVWFIFTICAV
jgi:hypothetical protein